MQNAGAFGMFFEVWFPSQPAYSFGPNRPTSLNAIKCRFAGGTESELLLYVYAYCSMQSE